MSASPTNQPQQLYCMNCGNQIPARARFCRICGASQETEYLDLQPPQSNPGPSSLLHTPTASLAASDSNSTTADSLGSILAVSPEYGAYNPVSDVQAETAVTPSTPPSDVSASAGQPQIPSQSNTSTGVGISTSQLESGQRPMRDRSDKRSLVQNRQGLLSRLLTLTLLLGVAVVVTWNIIQPSGSSMLGLFPFGHLREVYSVAFSPDGQTLASGSGDNTIKLWSVASGQLLHTLSGHRLEVRSVAFSPDGQTLASGSEDGTIKLWDVSTGQWKDTLFGRSGVVFSVAFLPDGETLASGLEDGRIKLWSVSTGRELRYLAGYGDSVYQMAFSPDGKISASTSLRDDTIKLWSVSSGQMLRTLPDQWEEKRQGRQLISVAFSPDGQTLASGFNYGPITLWSVSTWQVLRYLSGHSRDGGWRVAFSPDGQTLASEWGSTIKLWNVSTGQEIRTLFGHWGGVSSIAFSPDGRTLASGSWDKTVRLWQLK